MASFDNQLVREEVAVVLEELLQQCCSDLDANTLTRNKSKSREINVVINRGPEHIDNHEDTLCTSNMLTSQVTDDQDQIMELMPMQNSSLNREDENDILQLMASMLDKCCENSQKVNVAEEKANEFNKGSLEISYMVGLPQEKNTVNDIDNHGKGLDFNDCTQLGEQNEEEKLELQKVYLVQELVTQKGHITNFQCESNQSLITRSPSHTTNPSHTIKTPEKEIFLEDQGFKSRPSINVSDSMNIPNDFGQKQDKIVTENEFSFAKNEKEVEKNTVRNVLPLNTLCLETLHKSSAEILDHMQLRSLKMLAVKSILKQKNYQTDQTDGSDIEQSLFKKNPSICAPNQNQLATETNPSISEGDQNLATKNKPSISEHELNLAMETKPFISEGDQNLAIETKPFISEGDQNLAIETKPSISEHDQDLAMEMPISENSVCKENNAEETHERQTNSFLLISTEQEQNLCDNKITFVQSLGLSPLKHEGKDLEADVSYVACLAEKQQHEISNRNLTSEYKKPGHLTNKKNSGSCFENEVFEKIKIDDEFNLIVEQTIPCKRMKLENDLSGLHQLSDDENQREICQMVGDKYSAITGNVPIVSIPNTSTGTDVNKEDTVTIDEDGNKDIDGVEYVEPQIILKEELSNNYEGDLHDTNGKKTKDSFDHVVDEIVVISKRRDFVVAEEQHVQSSEQLVPSAVNNEQLHIDDAESLYEEDNAKFQASSHIKETILDDQKDTTDDSVHGVPVYESTKCFKWKYTPSYETDAVVPNSERDDNDSSCKMLLISTCKKPIRLGLSKKQSRLVSLHPYIKKQ
ncbi:uncharacterized protein LOC128164490 [Crassostrea angulata]|uniref:uncharacterized protein LOC128164490 n=1 Tax=Magallana angulata TaxID=2784310 RepID=UPI0022B0C6A6|nr:uncharacterized protein LOC128164490 [Crassostrea angulata]